MPPILLILYKKSKPSPTNSQTLFQHGNRLHRPPLHLLRHPGHLSPPPRPQQHPSRSLLDGVARIDLKRGSVGLDAFHTDHVFFSAGDACEGWE